MGNPAFDGIKLLLIDGNNLLHRYSGSVEPAAQAALEGRLRAAIPATLRTVMLRDGPADTTRPALPGLAVRYAGPVSADDELINLVRGQPAETRHEIVVVTDDRALADRARTLGARTRRLDWLTELIDRRPPGAVSIGHARPPNATGDEQDEERAPWRPGRGATRKRGNPRRGQGGSGRARRTG